MPMVPMFVASTSVTVTALPPAVTLKALAGARLETSSASSNVIRMVVPEALVPCPLRTGGLVSSCAWACSGRARSRQATKTARQVARNADADGTDAARLAARRVDALREGGSAAERLAAGATDGS